MREIKFRLRDRFNHIAGYEKWYEGKWHPDNPDEGFSLTSGYWEASPSWLYSINGVNWTPTFIPHRLKDRVTGLLDKNGKEIYEGDIVKANWGRGEIALSVVYEDGAFVLIIPNDSYRDMAGEDNNKYYEVIGNIYENAELVKQ